MLDKRYSALVAVKPRAVAYPVLPVYLVLKRPEYFSPTPSHVADF